MKQIVRSLSAAGLILLTGCLVTSVYPFYTAKDLAFDPALLGRWLDAKLGEGEPSWQFEKMAAQTYRLTWSNASGTNVFDTHLFTLGAARFLDCLSRDRPPFQTPQHFIFRVTNPGAELELHPMSYAWLGKLLETNPAALRHLIVPGPAGDGDKNEPLILTANTAELQQFIRQHLATTNAWGPPICLKKP